MRFKNVFLFSVVISSLTSLPVISAESDENKKVFPMDPKAACVTSECHAGMGKKKYVHPIGSDPGKCDRCHYITKAGEHRFDPIPEETRVLCSACHSEDKSKPSDVKGNPPKVISSDKDVTLHRPFAEGKCSLCHDAHESDFYRHLKGEYPAEPYAVYSTDAYKLCSNVQCHKGLEKTLSEPRTLSDTMFRNGNVNLHYKHVNKKKGRTCRTCHQHHGSRNPMLITNTFRFGSRTLTNEYEKTDTGGSCKTTCHRKAIYDRYTPVFNVIRTTPTPGKDATAAELKQSREQDMQKDKIKGTPDGNEK
jgi:predicted CXXCH cytochrome family protein